MTDIIIQGIYGRMGRTLVEKIAARTDCRVVAGVDREDGRLGEIPVYDSFAKLPCGGVIIDFSSPAGSMAAAAYGAEKHLPCVICSTGFTPEQEETLHTISAQTPVFRSANMSLGVNVLIELARQTVRALGSEFDIEIIEKHHRNKLDAPSGTALMIADAAASACGHETEYVFERHSVRQPRDKKEIGISAVRGGTIVGEHEIIFAGHDEIMEIRHTALSREIFAQGAVEAAKFMATVNAPGLYDMSQLVK